MKTALQALLYTHSLTCAQILRQNVLPRSQLELEHRNNGPMRMCTTCTRETRHDRYSKPRLTRPPSQLSLSRLSLLAEWHAPGAAAACTDIVARRRRAVGSTSSPPRYLLLSLCDSACTCTPANVGARPGTYCSSIDKRRSGGAAS